MNYTIVETNATPKSERNARKESGGGQKRVLFCGATIEKKE